MEDADAMRQRVIDAVNECEDIELLDLIYRILGADARNGGGVTSAVFLLPRADAVSVKRPAASREKCDTQQLKHKRQAEYKPR